MNPYGTPESSQPDTQTTNGNPSNSELREIVTGWEKLRIRYNIILFVFGVIAIFMIMMNNSVSSFWEMIPGIIMFAIFANVCYCGGPAAEIYFRVIFEPRNVRFLRIALFIIGTCVSLIPSLMLVLFSLAGGLFPIQK